MTTWGTITVGRMALRETVTAAETVNANSGERTLRLAGQESSPPLTAAQLVDRHDGIIGLFGALVQVAFADKTDRNGYYTVADVSASQINQQGELLTCDWTLALRKIGSDTETDIQSRLTHVARQNDFSLTGEKWHAPPVGHYAYDATSSGQMSRTTTDGVITVYRGLGSGANPRWGCAVADYMKGRSRVLSASLEKAGQVPVPVTGWEINNGLVQVTPAASGSTLAVAMWSGSAWASKTWNISDGTVVTGWDAATIVRNDPEQVIVRLTREQGASEAGRMILDITLRRGSRVAEFYLQRSSSATLSVFLATAETFTDNSASGYVVKSTDDAAGNRATAGSARSFTAHANGGVTKAAATALGFYLGVVAAGGSAVSGDAATDLRNQYIAALPEMSAGVRR